ncbi:hypothetical protein [Methanococcoides methylutens]|uniref:hypothetical protein n=1 Tax=Methanococcoides methylutens TaxID=2226 RepID=UPI0012E0073A|nr:hypothetical protein [Methanococcoides methylutens]
MSILDKNNDDDWCVNGSITYGFGMGWVIVGLSLTFDIIGNLHCLAYLTLIFYSLSLFIYYALRKRKIKNEPNSKKRSIARVVMLLQLLLGGIILYLK